MEVIDARKHKIAASHAWELVSQAEEITVAKGKKVLSFDSVAGEQEAIVKQIMGPSGNLRAPALRVGTIYVIGFNEEMYKERLPQERW